MVNSITCQRESPGVYQRCDRDVRICTTFLPNRHGKLGQIRLLSVLKKSSWQAAYGSLRGLRFLNRYRDLRATIFSKHPELFPSQVFETLLGSLSWLAQVTFTSLPLCQELIVYVWDCLWLRLQECSTPLQTNFKLWRLENSSGVYFGGLQMGFWYTLLPSRKFSHYFSLSVDSICRSLYVMLILKISCWVSSRRVWSLTFSV